MRVRPTISVIPDDANGSAQKRRPMTGSAAIPDAQLRIRESRDFPMCNCTSQFDALHRPGMTACL
jgi:hypothetical protein